MFASSVNTSSNSQVKGMLAVLVAMTSLRFAKVTARFVCFGL